MNESAIRAKIQSIDKTLNELKEQLERGYIDSGRYSRLKTDWERQKAELAAQLMDLPGNQAGNATLGERVILPDGPDETDTNSIRPPNDESGHRSPPTRTDSSIMQFWNDYVRGRLWLYYGVTWLVVTALGLAANLGQVFGLTSCQQLKLLAALAFLGGAAILGFSCLPSWKDSYSNKLDRLPTLGLLILATGLLGWLAFQGCKTPPAITPTVPTPTSLPTFTETPTGIPTDTVVPTPCIEYQVKVQVQGTLNSISNATVIISGCGAPKDDVTDTPGTARIFIDTSCIGKRGRLEVKAEGYESYVKQIDLKASYDIIQLEPLNPSPLPTTPSSTSAEMPTPEDFDYQVNVRVQGTSNGIANAAVTIFGCGAPKNDVTDAGGVARIFIDASCIGNPGRLMVAAEGYESYDEHIDLKKGSLPDVVPLEPSTPTSAPTTPSLTATEETPTVIPAVPTPTTPSPTATETPTDTPTVTSPPPNTPTPTLLPAPTLTEPENGAAYCGGASFTLKWRWDEGLLQDDEYFATRIWKEGNVGHSEHWVKNEEIIWDLDEAPWYYGEGTYLWNIAVVRGVNSQDWEPVSQTSENRWFRVIENCPPPHGGMLLFAHPGAQCSPEYRECITILKH